MSRFLVLFIAALAALAQVPPQPTSTDAQIEAQLHDRLTKSVIGKDGFVAKVKAGIVYWEGTTTVAQHKGAATRMAKSSGARRVVNNIKVNKKAGGTPALPKPTAQAGPPPIPAAPPPLKRVTVQWRQAKP
jgi:hypothetical protein